jgi:hypothetical protein
MNRRSADPARVHDAARLLPLLGAVLLMPPVITLFVVYLFCTWLALIVCAAWLSRALAAPPSNGDQDPGPPRG